VLEHFAPCPYWYFTFFRAGNIFQSLEPDLLHPVTGTQEPQIKMLGKTIGDSPNGEGKPRPFSANSVIKYSGLLDYSLLITFNSSLIIVYSLLIIF
jgi:hypothetical protein